MFVYIIMDVNNANTSSDDNVRNIVSSFSRTIPGTSQSEKDRYWRENLEAELKNRRGYP